MVRCDTFTLLEPLHDVLGGGSDVGIRGAAGNDEEVGGVGNAGKIEEDDVGGLEVQGEGSSALGGGERRGGRRLGHSGTVQESDERTASAVLPAEAGSCSMWRALAVPMPTVSGDRGFKGSRAPCEYCDPGHASPIPRPPIP